MRPFDPSAAAATVSTRTGSPQGGFTLTELAIVLVIVALLIGGMLLPLSAQQDLRNNAEAQKALNEIRDAIIGFAVAKGRLPCPADPSLASTDANAGKENCALTPPEEGTIPWADLGVAQLDPWGQRYRYRVTAHYMDAVAAATWAGCTPSPTPTQASFALCSQGDITVTNGSTAIASNAPAVILSHGKNHLGSYGPNGVQVAGATADELENANANATFVARPADSSGFDDQVTWISHYALAQKLVAVGKLP